MTKSSVGQQPFPVIGHGRYVSLYLLIIGLSRCLVLHALRWTTHLRWFVDQCQLDHHGCSLRVSLTRYWQIRPMTIDVHLGVQLLPAPTLGNVVSMTEPTR